MESKKGVGGVVWVKAKEGGEATKKEADGFFLIRCLFCLLPWLIGAPWSFTRHVLALELQG